MEPNGNPQRSAESVSDAFFTPKTVSTSFRSHPKADSTISGVVRKSMTKQEMSDSPLKKNVSAGSFKKLLVSNADERSGTFTSMAPTPQQKNRDEDSKLHHPSRSHPSSQVHDVARKLAPTNPTQERSDSDASFGQASLLLLSVTERIAESASDVIMALTSKTDASLLNVARTYGTTSNNPAGPTSTGSMPITPGPINAITALSANAESQRSSSPDETPLFGSILPLRLDPTLSSQFTVRSSLLGNCTAFTSSLALTRVTWSSSEDGKKLIPQVRKFLRLIVATAHISLDKDSLWDMLLRLLHWRNMFLLMDASTTQSSASSLSTSQLFSSQAGLSSLVAIFRSQKNALQDIIIRATASKPKPMDDARLRLILATDVVLYYVMLELLLANHGGLMLGSQESSSSDSIRNDQISLIRSTILDSMRLFSRPLLQGSGSANNATQYEATMIQNQRSILDLCGRILAVLSYPSSNGSTSLMFRDQTISIINEWSKLSLQIAETLGLDRLDLTKFINQAKIFRNDDKSLANAAATKEYSSNLLPLELLYTCRFLSLKEARRFPQDAIAVFQLFHDYTQLKCSSEVIASISDVIVELLCGINVRQIPDSNELDKLLSLLYKKFTEWAGKPKTLALVYPAWAVLLGYQRSTVYKEDSPLFLKECMGSCDAKGGKVNQNVRASALKALGVFFHFDMLRSPSMVVKRHLEDLYHRIVLAPNSVLIQDTLGQGMVLDVLDSVARYSEPEFAQSMFSALFDSGYPAVITVALKAFHALFDIILEERRAMKSLHYMDEPSTIEFALELGDISILDEESGLAENASAMQSADGEEVKKQQSNAFLSRANSTNMANIIQADVATASPDLSVDTSTVLRGTMATMQSANAFISRLIEWLTKYVRAEISKCGSAMMAQANALNPEKADLEDQAKNDEKLGILIDCWSQALRSLSSRRLGFIHPQNIWDRGQNIPIIWIAHPNDLIRRKAHGLIELIFFRCSALRAPFLVSVMQTILKTLSQITDHEPIKVVEMLRLLERLTDGWEAWFAQSFISCKDPESLIQQTLYSISDFQIFETGLFLFLCSPIPAVRTAAYDAFRSLDKFRKTLVQCIESLGRKTMTSIFDRKKKATTGQTIREEAKRNQVDAVWLPPSVADYTIELDPGQKLALTSDTAEAQDEWRKILAKIASRMCSPEVVEVPAAVFLIWHAVAEHFWIVKQYAEPQKKGGPPIPPLEFAKAKVTRGGASSTVAFDWLALSKNYLFVVCACACYLGKLHDAHQTNRNMAISKGGVAQRHANPSQQVGSGTADATVPEASRNDMTFSAEIATGPGVVANPPFMNVLSAAPNPVASLGMGWSLAPPTTIDLATNPTHLDLNMPKVTSVRFFAAKKETITTRELREQFDQTIRLWLRMDDIENVSVNEELRNAIPEALCHAHPFACEELLQGIKSLLDDSMLFGDSQHQPAKGKKKKMEHPLIQTQQILLSVLSTLANYDLVLCDDEILSFFTRHIERMNEFLLNRDLSTLLVRNAGVCRFLFLELVDTMITCMYFGSNKTFSLDAELRLKLFRVFSQWTEADISPVMSQQEKLRSRSSLPLESLSSTLLDIAGFTEQKRDSSLLVRACSVCLMGPAHELWQNASQDILSWASSVYQKGVGADTSIVRAGLVAYCRAYPAFTEQLIDESYPTKVGDAFRTASVHFFITLCQIMLIETSGRTFEMSSGILTASRREFHAKVVTMILLALLADRTGQPLHKVVGTNVKQMGFQVLLNILRFYLVKKRIESASSQDKAKQDGNAGSSKGLTAMAAGLQRYPSASAQQYPDIDFENILTDMSFDWRIVPRLAEETEELAIEIAHFFVRHLAFFAFDIIMEIQLRVTKAILGHGERKRAFDLIAVLVLALNPASNRVNDVTSALLSMSHKYMTENLASVQSLWMAFATNCLGVALPLILKKTLANLQNFNQETAQWIVLFKSCALAFARKNPKGTVERLCYFIYRAGFSQSSVYANDLHYWPAKERKDAAADLASPKEPFDPVLAPIPVTEIIREMNLSDAAIVLISDLIYESRDEIRKFVPWLLHAAVIRLDNPSQVLVTDCKYLLTNLVHTLVMRYPERFGSKAVMRESEEAGGKVLKQILSSGLSDSFWTWEENHDLDTRISDFVLSITEALKHAEKDIQIRWSRHAIHFASASDSFHLVYRSLQVFRGLRPALENEVIRLMVKGLTNCERSRMQHKQVIAAEIMEALVSVSRLRSTNEIALHPQLFWVATVSVGGGDRPGLRPALWLLGTFFSRVLTWNVSARTFQFYHHMRPPGMRKSSTGLLSLMLRSGSLWIPQTAPMACVLLSVMALPLSDPIRQSFDFEGSDAFVMRVFMGLLPWLMSKLFQSSEKGNMERFQAFRTQNLELWTVLDDEKSEEIGMFNLCFIQLREQWSSYVGMPSAASGSPDGVYDSQSTMRENPNEPELSLASLNGQKAGRPLSSRKLFGNSKDPGEGTGVGEYNGEVLVSPLVELMTQQHAVFGHAPENRSYASNTNESIAVGCWDSKRMSEALFVEYTMPHERVANWFGVLCQVLGQELLGKILRYYAQHWRSLSLEDFLDTLKQVFLAPCFQRYSVEIIQHLLQGLRLAPQKAIRLRCSILAFLHALIPQLNESVVSRIRNEESISIFHPVVQLLNSSLSEEAAKVLSLIGHKFGLMAMAGAPSMPGIKLTSSQAFIAEEIPLATNRDIAIDKMVENLEYVLGSFDDVSLEESLARFPTRRISQFMDTSAVVELETALDEPANDLIYIFEDGTLDGVDADSSERELKSRASRPQSANSLSSFAPPPQRTLLQMINTKASRKQSIGHRHTESLSVPVPDRPYLSQRNSVTGVMALDAQVREGGGGGGGRAASEADLSFHDERRTNAASGEIGSGDMAEVGGPSSYSRSEHAGTAASLLIKKLRHRRLKSVSTERELLSHSKDLDL